MDSITLLLLLLMLMKYKFNGIMMGGDRENARSFIYLYFLSKNHIGLND